MIEDWYNTYIEKPIREIVKLLRNNGVNTICSCGHDMWIQAEYYEDIIFIKDLLYNEGYRDFVITTTVQSVKGIIRSHIEIRLDKPEAIKPMENEITWKPDPSRHNWKQVCEECINCDREQYELNQSLIPDKYKESFMNGINTPYSFANYMPCKVSGNPIRANDMRKAYPRNSVCSKYSYDYNTIIEDSSNYFIMKYMKNDKITNGGNKTNGNN